MGTTYKTPRSIRPGQSIFIATPAYDSIKPGCMWSLSVTTAELTRKGIPFELSIMHGNCHVDDGRNELVRQFLFESQCSDLVFIDSDVQWNAQMFLRLIKHDEDVVAGAYPLKCFPIKFPVGRILHIKEEPEEKRGLLEVSFAPTGFMRIRRSVFEKLAPKQSKRGKLTPTYRFFERRYTETTYDGGDVTFCRKWIAEGGKVIVDPTLTLEHIGEYRWKGCFLDYLGNPESRALHEGESKDPVPDYKPDHPQTKPQAQPVKGSPVGDPPREGSPTWTAVEALKGGVPVLEHFRILADAWGNKPWAATPEYLGMAYNMACNIRKGGQILECGSGISTTVLAIAAQRAGAILTVLDHSDDWQGKAQGWLKAVGVLDGVVFPSPNIKREIGWYDYAPETPPDLIIVDGPPHYMGTDRLYPLKQPWIGTAGVLLDDASSNALERLKSIKGHWIPFQFGSRPGCVGRAGIDENWTVEQLSNSAA